MPIIDKSQDPTVSIVILTYNAKKYIKKCLGSILAQTYSNIEIIIIDNNSSDETIRILNTTDYGQRMHKIIQNKNNDGFAAGQNQGIRASKGKYVLCLNQDAWLSKNYIQNAVKILEADNKISAIQGKLIRYDFDRDEILNKIDTTSLVMLKNRRIINRNQGESVEADNAKNKIEEIFGPDGATPIYRREALEDVKLLKSGKFQAVSLAAEDFEYFDEDFWMYKEDVDLAWRLRLYGWKSVYAPMCIGYHGRGAGDSAAKKYSDILKERRKISGMAKLYSWKNQRLMQIKNELPGLFFKHLPYILFKEIASWGYILIFEEPYALKSIWKFFNEIPSAYKKRQAIMSKKRVSDKEMEKWFN